MQLPRPPAPLPTATISRWCARLPGPRSVAFATRTLVPFERGRALRSAQLSALVAAVLGEPQAAARRIATASLDANTHFYADAQWLARQTPARRRLYIETLACPDATELRHLASTHRQPLVIASMHTRGYLRALLRTCHLLPQDRPIGIIKRAAPSARDAVFADLQASHGLQLLHTAHRPALAALAILRAGGVLFVMLDVPPSFDAGATYTAPLLGLPAALPAGPVELALAGRALLLPMTCSSAGIECAAPLDAAVTRADRASHRQRLQQQLAAQLDGWIRAWPERWLLWPHLPAFAAATADGACAAPAAARAHPPAPH